MSGLLMRGDIVTGRAQIGKVEPERAAFFPTGTIISLAPGDIFRPLWRVEPLMPKAGGWAVNGEETDSPAKRGAKEILQSGLTTRSPWSFVPLADVRRAHLLVDPRSPSESPAGVLAAAQALRASTVVVCDEPRIESKGDRYRASLRAIVYDAESGFPLAGAWQCGEWTRWSSEVPPPPEGWSTC